MIFAHWATKKAGETLATERRFQEGGRVCPLHALFL